MYFMLMFDLLLYSLDIFYFFLMRPRVFMLFKLVQVTHVRCLHTSGCGQKQEAVAVESEPAPFSIFRAQENDPVSKSDSNM